MDCKNHPQVLAVARCAGCGDSFCSNCLVAVAGKEYCASCKGLALQGMSMGEVGTVPCKQASEALTYAIVGLICFGIILEPIAIVKALKAKKMISMNPRLTGSGKATAALIIAITIFLLNAIYIASLFMR